MLRYNDIFSWELFLSVAQTGSIAKTAEIYSMEPTNVSRAISQLEKSINNISLFYRDKDGFVLTTAGSIIFKHARTMVEARESILDSVSEVTNGLSGTIRIGLPLNFLEDFLLKPIIEFNKQFPSIRIVTSIYRGRSPFNFEISNPPLDMVIGYAGEEDGENAISLSVGAARHIPCASPDYLKKYGMPKTIADLGDHRLIVLDRYYVDPHGPFFFFFEYDLSSKFNETVVLSSPTAATRAALIGAGIHFGIPALYCYQHIASGELIPITHLWKNHSFEHKIFIRESVSKQNKVKVFADFIRQKLVLEYDQCYAVLRQFLPTSWLD